MMYLLLSLISGILTALPINFPFLFFIPWLSLSLLAYVIFTRGYLFRHALMYGIGYFGVGYLFIFGMYPMEFTSLSHPAAAAVCFAGWLALVLISALPVALCAPICRLAYPLSCRIGGVGEALALAASFSLLERLTELLPAQVPMLHLAVTQTECLPLIQTAALFGSPFIAFAIVFVASMLALGFRSFTETESAKTAPAPSASHRRYRKLVPGERTEKKKTRWRWAKKNGYVIAATLTVLLSYVFGLLHIALDEDTGEAKTVSIIQANIGSDRKWGDISADEAVSKYLELSAYSADSDEPDIIVWPETAVNVDLGYYESYAERLEQFASESGSSLIIGAFSKTTDYDGEENRITKTYNSVYSVSSDGELGTETVSKKKLVPFGEYTPLGGLFRRIMPKLGALNLGETELTPGTDSGALSTEHGTVGALICYDLLYGDTAVSAVKNGAEALFILSNDSWYGEAGSSILVRNSVLRAVETGRYTVRSASTGISAFISPTGVIYDSLASGEEGYITESIGMRSADTVFFAAGRFFPVLCGVFLLSGAVLNAVLFYRERKILRD